MNFRLTVGFFGIFLLFVVQDGQKLLPDMIYLIGLFWIVRHGSSWSYMQ